MSVTAAPPEQQRSPGVAPGRRRVRPAAIVVGLLVALVIVAISPAANVRTIEVQGTGPSLARVVERDIAQVVGDRPLVRVDVESVRAAALDASPLVRDVDVQRVPPATVRIVVTPRRAVLAFVDDDRSRSWVDAEGNVAKIGDGPPESVPTLTLAGAVQGPDATQRAVRDAVAVVAALPADKRRVLTSIEVRTPDDIRLTLRGGREVRWGSAEDSAAKSAVLVALLRRPATVYDVSAPDLPTTRNAG